jgi:hypothetical protein
MGGTSFVRQKRADRGASSFRQDPIIFLLQQAIMKLQGGAASQEKQD